ncbi:acyl-CoA dehydrogenase family protein [Nocardioides montaniterrae]
MDFALSPEQEELVRTVRSLVAKRASPRVDDLSVWSALAGEIGVAALAIPEEHEGVGASFFETALVLEELGRSLTPTPMLATALATEALLAGGTDQAKERLLPRIAEGAVATLVLDADRPVLDADRADIVLALVDDELVEVTDARATWAESMDQTLHLAHVASTTGDVIGSGAPARERAETVAAAGVAALAAGLCRRALDMTVAYTKDREQFGRPIGSFQALKHRMADMLLRTELARSTAWAAAYAVAANADDAPHQAAAAAAYTLEAAAHLAGECIQLHGGIAITWEHDAHLVLKRAHALGQLFGSAADHRRAVRI